MNKIENQNWYPLNNDKKINIFLSSTFNKQMRDKRACFKNEISSRLNHIYGKLGYNVYLFDLELGVPEDVSNYKTLKICYKKIEECDYFLCILGYNYGTLLKQFIEEDNSVLGTDYIDYINDFIKDDLGITESEVRLADQKGKNKAFFIHSNINELTEEDIKNLRNDYLSWTEYSSFNPPDHSQSFCEFVDSRKYNKEYLITTIEEFTKSLEEKYKDKNYRENKIAELVLKGIEKVFLSKEFIINNKLINISEVCIYSNEKELTEKAIAYFEREISNNAKYTKNINENSEDKKTVLITTRKTRYYIENKKNTQDIFDYIEGSINKVLVLKGEKGSGKSSVIANVERILRNENSCEIIPYYVGIESSSAYDILKGINDKLFANCKSVSAHIDPSEFSMIREFYYVINHYPKDAEKAVILIDGFENIQYIRETKSMYWLPMELPHNIKIIVSTTMNNIEDAFCIMDIEKPPINDVIYQMFLAEGKEEEFGKIEAKLKSTESFSDNPDFAAILAREIMMESNYKNINNNINDFFSNCTSYKEIMKRYIKRIYSRLDSDGSDVCQKVLVCLCLVKYGIPQDKLINMVSDKAKLTIYQMYYDLTINDKNVLSISDSVLQECVMEIFSEGKSNETVKYEINRYREQIISALMDVDDYPEDRYLFSEIIHQLYKLDETEKLAHALSDVKRVDKIAYNIRLLVKYLYAAKENMQPLINRWEYDSKDNPLQFMGRLFKELNLIDRAIEYEEKYFKPISSDSANDQLKPTREQMISKANLYCDIALSLENRSPFAYQYAEEAMKIYTEQLGEDHIYTVEAAYILADVYYDKSESIRLYERCNTIVETKMSKNHPSLYEGLMNMGVTYSKIREYDNAAKCYLKAKNILSITYGTESEEWVAFYNNMGTLQHNIKKYQSAIKYYDKALNIAEKTFGKFSRQCATQYNFMALTYKKMHERKKSKLCKEREQEIYAHYRNSNG